MNTTSVASRAERKGRGAARNRAARLLAGAGASLACASAADGTWSIILIDLRTKEIAVGSATCLTSFDLQANTPVLITGVGAATAQSFVDSTGQNRVFIRDRLGLGVAPADIITGLSTFDSGHQTRQYGIADVLGRAATFSGTGANAWAGGQTGTYAYTHLGRTGDVVYAIQGNILTGPCVVDAAVQAAINTPGDVAAKLMASMQAARVAGGDGRCSCPAAPTSCGCPPAVFTKSAHIAYMLIARTGDTDGSFGIYRAGSAPFGLAAQDITGDGRPELVCVNTSGNTLSVHANQTPPGNPFSIFASLPVSFPTGAQPRAVVLADVVGDATLDAVTCNLSGNTVSVLPGLPAGAFGPKADTLAGASPVSLVVENLNGVGRPDVAVANQSVDLVSVLVNNDAGGFLPAAQYAAGDEPRDIVAARFDADADIDLAVAARTGNEVRVLLNNGDGTFAPGAIVSVPTLPQYLAAGDFDGDTDIDLAAGTTGAPLGVTVLLNNGAGAFTPTTYALTATPTSLMAADVTGDGDPDLVAPIVGGRFVVLTGSPAGAFTVGPIHTVGATLGDGLAADLNGDGARDLAFPNQANSIVTADNRGGGDFPDGIGTATGDYFMEFNVAFQQQANPDPVATLQTQYDAWRGALVGRPDGVQSLVAVNPPVVPANGAAAAAMTITLRDWQGQAITAPIQSVQVTHAPGSAGSAAIGAVTALGGGVYEVALTAGTIIGEDLFRIVADDGTRPVSIMPDPALTLDNPCYPDCNNSGTLSVADFGCFQGRYALGDLYADCNASGTLTVADFGCFQGKYVLGCP